MHKQKRSLRFIPGVDRIFSNSLFLMILYIFIPKCFGEKTQTESCQSLCDVFKIFQFIDHVMEKEHGFIFRVVLWIPIVKILDLINLDNMYMHR